MPGAESDGDGGGWFDRLVPQFLAAAALSVSVRAPEAIRLGDPTSFYVVVRNRSPIPGTVSTPTSRLWGWEVDGIHEADTRSFSPPETGRSVRFGGFERKVFQATWDGRICEEHGGETVWSDATGTHTLRGYLAVENWERKGLFAETEVTVTEAPAHQE